MPHDALLQIGSVARLFHLSVSSLRHYEAAGLLTPEYTDPVTGYRYYGTRQFEVLNTIRYLRALDMPLPQIREFLQNRDVETIEAKLRHQKAAVEEKQRELQRVARKIDNRLRQLADAQSSPLDEIDFLRTKPCRLVWMQDSLRPDGYTDMEASIRRLEQSQAEAVVFLGKVGLSLSPALLEAGQFSEYDGIFLVLDDEELFEGDTLHLPAQLCARIRFRGRHPLAPPRYERLMDCLRARGLRPAGFSREITIIDDGLTRDPSKFVTEIVIPVEESREIFDNLENQ